MGVRPDAPTIETIVPVTFYEIGKANGFGKRNPPGTAEIKIRIEISPERFYRADQRSG
jgi:hypothetical protein